MSQLDDDLAIAPPRPADVAARITRELYPRGRSGLVAIAGASVIGVVIAFVQPASAAIAVGMLPGIGLELSRLRTARRFARDGLLVSGVVQPIDAERAIVTVEAVGTSVLRFTTLLRGFVGHVQVLMLTGARTRRVYVIGPSGIVPCKVDLAGLPRAQLRG